MASRDNAALESLFVHNPYIFVFSNTHGSFYFIERALNATSAFRCHQVTFYPGWIADLITQHDCGVAVPPDNAPALADALENLAIRREDLPAMDLRRALASREYERNILADRSGHSLLRASER